MKNNPASKNYFYLILGLIVLCVLLIAAILFAPKFFSFIPSNFKPNSENTTQIPKLSTISIDELVFQDGSQIIYKMRGKFIEPVYFFSDYLRGDFIIENEKTQTPVTIYFPKRGGKISAAKVNLDSPQKEATFVHTSVEDLEQMIEKNKLVELRIVARKSDIEMGNAISARMKALILGESPNKNEVFVPEAIKLLE